jgi:hypothetical protein
MNRTLVTITFDEADNQIPIAAINNVYTLLGPIFEVGTYKQYINHYDVRRTIEDKLKLAQPHRGRQANPGDMAAATIRLIACNRRVRALVDLRERRIEPSQRGNGGGA